MKAQDYTKTIEARTSVQQVLDAIADVGRWWTTSFTGASKKVGDTFGVRFGDTFVNFKVVEHGAAKIVWHVIDSRLPWLKDVNEWTGTDVIWEIEADSATTHVTMTHKGLLPTVECFENCERGWNFYVGESLPKLLADGEGLPDGKKRDHGEDAR